MSFVVHPGTVRIEGRGRSLAPLHGALRAYDWGSRTLLARLQGRASPAAGPEAELWFGAHPSGSAHLDRADGPLPLRAAIEHDPEGELGAVHLGRFGARLPFLVKLLAVDRALSVQVHPRAADAAAGFAAEERAGLAPDDPERGFPDPWGKRETVVALTPFEARAGFRTLDEVECVLEALAPGTVDELRRLVPEAAPPSGPPVVALAAAILSAAPDVLGRVLDRLVAGARSVTAAAAPGVEDVLLEDARLLLRLVEGRPGDAGAVLLLMLEPHRLRAGDALEVPPGVVHSYQRGTAVEVMVESDCVLRLGMTSKVVRPREALALVAADERPRPVPSGSDPSDLHRRVSGAAEYALAPLVVDGERSWPRDTRAPGPAVLLCTEGRVESTTGEDRVRLGPGGAAFASDRAGDVVLSGRGSVLAVTVGPVEEEG